MPVVQSLDLLEAELEAKIESEASAYRSQPLPKASLETSEVRQLEKDQRALERLCQEISSQLKALDQQGEHETGRLHLNFEPLKARLSHFEEALRISGVFAEMAQRLAREQAEVKEACVALAKQFLPNHLSKFEAGLEVFQDRCDALADELDALENQGHEIKALLPAYEEWLAWVERFGEILDERVEALRPGA